MSPLSCENTRTSRFTSRACAVRVLVSVASVLVLTQIVLLDKCSSRLVKRISQIYAPCRREKQVSSAFGDTFAALRRPKLVSFRSLLIRVDRKSLAINYQALLISKLSIPVTVTKFVSSTLDRFTQKYFEPCLGWSEGKNSCEAQCYIKLIVSSKPTSETLVLRFHFQYFLSFGLSSFQHSRVWQAEGLAIIRSNVFIILKRNNNNNSNMAQCPPLLSRLVASSVTASAHAGKIIRDVLSKGELNIVEKGKNDLQTEADRSAQKCIIESLTRQFPGVTIIGEEGASSCEIPKEWIIKDMDQEVLKLKLPQHLENVEPKDVCVWVDPLDGTSEYTQGLVEHVTVLVGVAVGDRAVGGVIHQPYYRDAKNSIVGRTLWGIDGVGTGGFKTIPPVERKRIITTTRSHSNQTVQAALDAMEPDEVLRVGGAGHKVLLLLEGKAHAYVFASGGCKRWDTCAPEAILHAVGGRLTDLYGERYPYGANTLHPNTRGVLATAPGQIHSWYISRIPEEVKQQLH